MDLRYRLAVVTGAGRDPGREVAVALSRVGAAVLSVDSDLVAAEETAASARAARVRTWALQADPARDDERRMLAARARDLGGMDLLVTATAVDLGARQHLTDLFLAGLAQRRGRRDGTPAIVHIGSAAELATPGEPGRLPADLTDPVSTDGARVMAVVVGSPQRPLSGAPLGRVVVELLSRGAAGEVVEVAR